MKKFALGFAFCLAFFAAIGIYSSKSIVSPENDRKSPSFVPFAQRLAMAAKLEKSWRTSLDDPKHVAPPVTSEIAAATQLAHSIPAGEPEFAQAQELIARLDKNAAQVNAAKEAADAQRSAELKVASEKAMKAAAPGIRKELAQTFEHEFLMRNMDARFVAEGKDATTLHFKYVLAGRPLAEQLKTDGTFLNRCREAGFKSVILDDTFGNIFTFNL